MLTRRIIPLLLACALSAVTGCDSLDTGDFNGATGALGSEQFDGADSAGGEDAGEDEEFDPTHLLQCEQPVPCDAMPLDEEDVAPENAQQDASAVEYSATERCVLESLARGEPALIQTVADFSTATAYLDFAIVGDRAALRQAHGDGESVGSWANLPSGCQLRDSTYFEGCLASPDPECLRPTNWVDSCEDLGALICPLDD